MSSKQLFDAALQHHQAGRLSEAEDLYRQLLDAQPNHADALHLLGVLLHQHKGGSAAVAIIRRAITYRPNFPVAHYNLGNILKELQRFDEAIAAYRLAIAQQPNYPDAMNNLGLVLKKQGKLEEAVAIWQSAIALNPGNPEICSNLAGGLNEIGRSEHAIAFCRKALSLRANYPEAYCNMAVALSALGRLDECIAAYRQAILLRPNYVDAYSNLSDALRLQGKLDEAMACCRMALAHAPNYPKALCNLGNVLRDQGQVDQAIAAYQQAISVKAGYAEGNSNLGNALKDKGELDQAIAAYRQAIADKSDYAEGYSNLGTALKDKGLVDEAIATYRRAIELRPNYAEAHHNLALTLLLRGEFSAGWQEHEWRWRVKQLSTRPKFSQPQWDGSPLPDGTIFLHCEQGFGDSIQFARYVPLVGGRCARVIVQCPQPLRTLLETVSPAAIYLASEDPLPEFDVECPLLTLPLMFGTTLETIPCDVPYLHANESSVQHWQTRLSEDRSGRKVGLVWGGNSAHKNDRNRSMPLSLLSQLGEVSGVSFYSLQKGAPADQARQPIPGFNLIDWTNDLADFADTAAFIANLDLVISVDTSVSHLAGALGKPVWTLLPFAPDWRWLLARSDSPWYPTMRLFRQPTIGNWKSVLQDVIAALQNLSRG